MMPMWCKVREEAYNPKFIFTEIKVGHRMGVERSRNRHRHQYRGLTIIPATRRVLELAVTRQEAP